MLTLNKPSHNQELLETPMELCMEHSIRVLGPAMIRNLAETAAAFINVPAFYATLWQAPRLSGNQSFQCSQRNLGEKFELTCNLSVETEAWKAFFTAGESEQFQLDAFCEMANCVCGALLADPSLTDEIGYLTPCVPTASAFRPAARSRNLRGAFRLASAWIHFIITLQEGVGIMSLKAPALSAVA